MPTVFEHAKVNGQAKPRSKPASAPEIAAAPVIGIPESARLAQSARSVGDIAAMSMALAADALMGRVDVSAAHLACRSNGMALRCVDMALKHGPGLDVR